MHKLKQGPKFGFVKPPATVKDRLCEELSLPDSADLLVATEVKLVSGEKLGVRDVVWMEGGGVGEVTRFVHLDGVALARVHIWSKIVYNWATGVGIYRLGTASVFVPCAQILGTAIYRVHSDGSKCSVIFDA